MNVVLGPGPGAKDHSSTISFTKRDAKVVGFASLAGLIALLAQAPSGKTITNAIKNGIDDVMYSRSVTSDRYTLAEYRIHSGDTISRISHGNQMVEDYIRLANGIKNIGNLQPGTTITVPVKSDNGKTLPELFIAYNSSH